MGLCVSAMLFDIGAHIWYDCQLHSKQQINESSQYNQIMPINKTSKVKDNIKPESLAPERCGVCNNFKLQHANGTEEVYI